MLANMGSCGHLHGFAFDVLGIFWNAPNLAHCQIVCKIVLYLSWGLAFLAMEDQVALEHVHTSLESCHRELLLLLEHIPAHAPGQQPPKPYAGAETIFSLFPSTWEVFNVCEFLRLQAASCVMRYTCPLSLYRCTRMNIDQFAPCCDCLPKGLCTP